MIRRLLLAAVLAAANSPVAARAQTPLTLDEALQRARTGNTSVRIADAVEREAAQRLSQARAGYWPRLDLVESWQRGNQPVFVFSSLLSQRRFAEANFGIDRLNHPDAIDAFRTAVTVEQPLFDRSTNTAVTSARIGRDMAAAGRTATDQEVAAAVTAAYADVFVAVAARESAESALASAHADRELAASRRDAGVVTDADVLQLDVHVSQADERRIRARAEEQIARARLNRLIGAPLDARFVLDPSRRAAPIDTSDLRALEAEAVANRPDLTIAALQERLASASVSAARAAWLPQVSAQAGWELNGGAWNARESSWIVGVVARVSLFRGPATPGRLAEARVQQTRRALEAEQAIATARLEVREVVARLEAARASETVGRAAVAQATESHRIVRDRYEGGLADAASLLRASDALVAAEAQQAAARAAVLTGTAALERALGRR